MAISKSNPKALYEHTPWSGFAGPLRVRYSAAATRFADWALASDLAFASATESSATESSAG